MTAIPVALPSEGECFTCDGKLVAMVRGRLDLLGCT